MRNRFIAALSIVLCLALAACGGASKAPTSAPAAPTSAPAGQQASTPVPARPTSTPLPAAQPTAAQEEELELGEASDLSKLNSYRTHYTLTWDVTNKDGQKESGSWDMREELVREPPAHHTTWTGTGTGSQGGTFEIIQIGQDTYVKSDNEWMAMTSADQTLFGGDEYMSDPFGAISGERGKLVKRGEMVNGVSCDHYTFDESTLGSSVGMGAVSKAKGDTWVSTEFKVVVKYIVHYEGSGLAISGSDGEGTMDMTFDVTDINKPISILPPAGVKPAMPDDIPVIDGATELSAMSGVVSFKTTKSVDEVTAFYAAQMPLKGWSEGESPTPEMMSFTKGGRTAQIMLSEEDGKTTVVIFTAEQ